MNHNNTQYEKSFLENIDNDFDDDINYSQEDSNNTLIDDELLINNKKTLNEDDVSEEVNNFSRMRYDLLNGLVPVAVEIGRINLSLSSILKLKAGESIEVTSYPLKVKLRSSDSYFAEGVLVDLDGQIAVKITQVF